MRSNSGHVTPGCSGSPIYVHIHIFEHLPAQSDKEQVQGVRRWEHLPAQSDKAPLQGLRGGGHLPAQSEKEHVQGVRRGGHLPARSEKEQVQDVQSRQGRLDAAGPRGALKVTHTLLHTLASANVILGRLMC